MMVRTTGSAKRLATAGRSTFHLGDWGEDVPNGSGNHTQLAKIFVDDISGNLIQYTLTYRLEDGGSGYKQCCTFGGTFWVDWEEDK